MGDMDEGFEDEPPYRLSLMYQVGHSDGYTHFYSGPLYKTFDAAKIAGEGEHGNYAVEPKAQSCIILDDGRVFVIDGPYKTADEVALEAEVKKRLLDRLTPYEKKLLGIK